MTALHTAALTVGLIMALPGIVHAGKTSSSNYDLVYSRADFRSPQTIQELHARIVRKARSHCPSYFITRSLADTRNCVRDVVNHLIQVIDHPQLTAFTQDDALPRLATEKAGTDTQSRG